ncbi:uncharacterized protein MAM_08271 [Metarhizium album ARSEF 1941]|uniref:Restriction of telomere capping protein 4 n=1 Tax=Metarhizium album (strain ARSEF 1941) TaxID=1081103 RepID=A0A0B2WJI7_METAS|nr:uncharacterized protein MAM_08271 [Metarhizium album ARSEF 1941]KHN93849.1 hypothetical protein MAM_08271 [Metarhizium album ARSEF 1941]
MGVLNNGRGYKAPVRRVGLSKNQAPSQLLSVINSVPRHKAAKNVDDPPVSSGDEDEDTTLSTDSPTNVMTQRKSAPKGSPTGRARKTKTLSSLVDSSDSSGEGDDRAARANIKSTSFGITRKIRSKRRDSPVEPAEDSEDLDSKRRKTGAALQRTQRKEPRSTLPTNPGEHLKDELGFTKIRKSKATYKTGKQSSKGQPVTKSSTESRAISRSITPPGAGKKRPSAKLRVPASLQSPEKPRTDRLRLPPGSIPPSPPSKTTLNLPSSIDSSQGSTGSRWQKKSKLRAIPRSPSPPRAVFKMPASISDLRLGSPREGRTEGPSTDDPSDMENQDGKTGKLSMDDEIKNVERIMKEATVCPWCGEPVDEKLLDDFAKGKRLDVRLQSKFCQKHKRQTAQELWQQKSYPKVEWEGLEDRFRKYHGTLLGVISGGASHFRSIHEKNISSGKARSLKKEDNLNPGYYGPRGFNLMCDYLVHEFSELLKEKAVDDRVIAGRGAAAFIQTVLVAELAVRLIMEDMEVAEEKARVILEESKALGEMIHEET